MNNPTPAPWTEILVRVPAAEAERAADIAHMVVPYGLYVEDYRELEQDVRDIAHIDLIDEALLQKDRDVAVIHLYIRPEDAPQEAVAFLRERYAAAGVPHEVDTASVREEDWAHNWKQFFKPFAVGERLLVCPTWEEPGDMGERAVLRIDPGMAFGTGGHETTRLVLEALERSLTPGGRMLDIGTGSGILAIAALLLGASEALGVDIDPVAVRTARENGAVNGFAEPRLRFYEGDLAAGVRGTYQLVAANIVADAIIALSPAVPPLLEPEGVYIVSGIIDTREAEVTAALEALGLRLAQRLELRGWICLIWRR